VIGPQGSYGAFRVLALAITLAMLPNADGSAAAEAASASAPPPTTRQVPEVTVTARRLELEQRISKFVNQIATPENGDEGLAR